MNGKGNVGRLSTINVVESFLILTLPSDFDEISIKATKNDLLNEMSQHSLSGAIIDFGAVKVMDSYEFNEFVELIKMVNLLGIECVAVGFNPGLVSALVDMNVETNQLTTFINLDSGLKYLQNKKFQEEEEQEFRLDD